MAIFEHTKNGQQETASVLDHDFPIYQQANPDEVIATLNDMIRMGDLFPITFPGPDGQHIPDHGELLIAWRTDEAGNLLFGASTV